MNRGLAFVVACFLLASGCAPKRSVIPSRPEQTLHDEHDLSVKKPEEFQLSNGLRVLYIQDQSLPLIRAQLLFLGGGLYTNPDETGVASITGSQIREGGVVGMTPAELDKRLDNLAASIESAIGDEYGTVNMRCLSENFDEVFDLFRRVVREPAFDSSRLELWRSQALEGIKRRREDQDYIAGVVFNQILFGKTGNYGALTTSAQVKQLRRAQLVDVYQRFSRPEHSILVITGAFDTEQMHRMVEEKFGDWKRREDKFPRLALPKIHRAPGIYVVEGRFAQAAIYIGHEGPERLTADAPSIGVFNRYFGSDAFGSVLFSEIRSKMGLAYSVGGGFVPGPKVGKFIVMMGTRATEAARAIDATLSIIKRVRLEHPKVPELERIRASFKRSFVFNFATPEGVAGREAMLSLLNYPAKYDEGFLARINSVSAQTVLDVALQRLDPSKLIVVIVGDVKTSQIKKQFGSRFPVKKVRFDEVPQF